jgi:hypothetical protein
MLRQRRLTSLATLSSDGSLLMILLYVLSGPCSVRVHNLFWNREECPFLATLYAVRIHTRRSLDRHDYTHSDELISSTHPSKMDIVLFCLFLKIFQPKIFIIMVFLSVQNVVVRISTLVKQGSKEDQIHESCFGVNVCLVPSLEVKP